MAFCPNCGSSLPENSSFCPNCGAPAAGQSGYGAQQQQSYGAQNTTYVYTQPPRYVQPYETGGLMAWSIITLLLCTIPGIVALVKTSAINKSTTVEEQQRNISAAKTWCIVGTVLGVLALIGVIANGGF